MVRGVSGVMGVTDLCRDLGREFEGEIQIKTDAIAAIGIASNREQPSGSNDIESHRVEFTHSSNFNSKPRTHGIATRIHKVER